MSPSTVNASLPTTDSSLKTWGWLTNSQPEAFISLSQGIHSGSDRGRLLLALSPACSLLKQSLTCELLLCDQIL